MMEQQLNETKVRKQIEIEEVDSKASAVYEERLAESLRELRYAIDSFLNHGSPRELFVFDFVLILEKVIAGF